MKKFLLTFIMLSWCAYAIAESPEKITFIKKDEQLYQSDKGVYVINSNEKIDYSHFTIKDGVLTLQGDKGIKRFIIKTDLSSKDIQGTWFEVGKEHDNEFTNKITRRENNYDYETTDLDHKLKTFYTTQKDDFKVPYKIIDSSIITEGSDYFYFVITNTPEATLFVDSFGDVFLEEIFVEQKLLGVPKGYSKE